MQEAEWMNDTTITKTQMQAFRDQLCWEEKSPGTMEKYCRDVAAFAAWLYFSFFFYSYYNFSLVRSTIFCFHNTFLTRLHLKWTEHHLLAVVRNVYRASVVFRELRNCGEQLGQPVLRFARLAQLHRETAQKAHSR